MHTLCGSSWILMSSSLATVSLRRAMAAARTSASASCRCGEVFCLFTVKRIISQGCVASASQLNVST